MSQDVPDEDPPPSLAEWLLERLDEDERVARAACRGRTGRWTMRSHESDPWIVTDDRGEFVIHDDGSPSDEEAEHIARHDPARVLAEVAAKRRIVDEHDTREVASLDRADWGRVHHVCRACRVGERQIVAPCPTLRLLALPYADAPGYRPEWRA